ncbi:MAG: ATP-binding cassette domain-containing protein [Candidatus Kerfeldbacteria bacterium]|nr:ATP-binding cassette domain-containing protein [Candidatus Kerfeldbacteria bacterium]
MNTINVTNLVKTYERTTRDPGFSNAIQALFKRHTVRVEAVRGVSFTVEPGSVVGFLGPNGAGKTTTLKMLSGILTPTSGSATVLGFTPWERKNEFRRRIGIVMGQRIQLLWDLPVSESLLLNKVLYEIPNDVYRQRLEQLATLLDAKELLAVQSRKLSLGQRMRCELMAALIHEPEVLFLDEPTVGLDVVSQKRIRDFLKEYVPARQTTVLLTSHNMEDVEELCKRVIVIHEGLILFDGALVDLRTKYATTKRITVQYTGTLPTLSWVEGVAEGEGSVSFDVPRARAHEAAREILASTDVLDITIEEPRVEQVIRRLFVQTGHSSHEVTHSPL